MELLVHSPLARFTVLVKRYINYIIFFFYNLIEYFIIYRKRNILYRLKRMRINVSSYKRFSIKWKKEIHQKWTNNLIVRYIILKLNQIRFNWMCCIFSYFEVWKEWYKTSAPLWWTGHFKNEDERGKQWNSIRGKG